MSVFASKRDARLFICEKSIINKKPFTIDKSDTDRLLVKCPKQQCPFKMIFRGTNEGVFHLVEEQQHECDALLPTIKRAWFREKIFDLIEERGKVNAKQLTEILHEKYAITPDEKAARNALLDVKKALVVDNRAFGLVSPFLNTLAKMNDGTTTSLMTKEGTFQRAFLCPGMCARAFDHTTKVVGLDACHIKARYGGVLLVMTVLDGNGQIFPVAVGIAESENTATWSWFLWLVQSALHINNGGEGLVCLSDREKGIENALGDVFPRAAHGFCVFHIQKNVLKAYHTDLDGLLFQAAKAATEKEFDEKLALINALDPDAGAYIRGIDKHKWARAFFPVRRLGHVTSNIAESANKWLDEARFQDPVGLFSTFIMRLNVVFEKRRDKYARMPRTALPGRVGKMLAKSVENGRTLRVRRHTRTLFQVQVADGKGQWKTVDLDRGSCTCCFSEEFEVPCQHMCAALLSLRDENLTRFVHPERQREALVNTYVGFIVPVDVSLLSNDVLMPPAATKTKGRPKEKRIPSCVEKPPRRTVTCSRCGARGHNARTCKKNAN